MSFLDEHFDSAIAHCFASFRVAAVVTRRLLLATFPHDFFFFIDESLNR